LRSRSRSRCCWPRSRSRPHDVVLALMHLGLVASTVHNVINQYIIRSVTTLDLSLKALLLAYLVIAQRKFKMKISLCRLLCQILHVKLYSTGLVLVLVLIIVGKVKKVKLGYIIVRSKA